MTIDQILNGTLEAECRRVMEQLVNACPPGHQPEIAIRIGVKDNGWFGCRIEHASTHESVGYGYGPTLDDSARQAIAMATSPERLNHLRLELQEKVKALQAQLDALPAPTPAPEANTEPVEAI